VDLVRIWISSSVQSIECSNINRAGVDWRFIVASSIFECSYECEPFKYVAAWSRLSSRGFVAVDRPRRAEFCGDRFRFSKRIFTRYDKLRINRFEWQLFFVG
jgi:hypothetical protein